MLLAALASTEIMLILIALLPIIAIIYLLGKNDIKPVNKLLLAALIIFIPVIGTIIYVIYNMTRPKHAVLK